MGYSQHVALKTSAFRLTKATFYHAKASFKTALSTKGQHGQTNTIYSLPPPEQARCVPTNNSHRHTAPAAAWRMPSMPQKSSGSPMHCHRTLPKLPATRHRHHTFPPTRCIIHTTRPGHVSPLIAHKDMPRRQMMCNKTFLIGYPPPQTGNDIPNTQRTDK